jgi:hypothetical protein
MVVVDASVLTVGLPNRSDALRDLPIRLEVTDTAIEAVQCLRHVDVDTVVSKWQLVDMPHGRFLERLIAAKPWIPTIAFIPAGDGAIELAARAAGVSAVLAEGVDDDFFRDTVCQLLGIETFDNTFKSIKTAPGAGVLVGARCQAEVLCRNNDVEDSSSLRPGFDDRPVMPVVESGEYQDAAFVPRFYTAPPGAGGTKKRA